MTAEPKTCVRPRRHRWQFGLRTILILPILVAMAGAVFHRIEHNRLQREAVHNLWRMGGLTADGPGEVFRGPYSGISWAHHHREGWFENLCGTHEPWAVLFDNEDCEYDSEEIAELLRGVPSIRHVFFEDGTISKEELDGLRLLVPDVRIQCDTNTP